MLNKSLSKIRMRLKIKSNQALILDGVPNPPNQNKSNSKYRRDGVRQSMLRKRRKRKKTTKILGAIMIKKTQTLEEENKANLLNKWVEDVDEVRPRPKIIHLAGVTMTKKINNKIIN